MQSLLAMAWDYSNNAPVISAVACDWNEMKESLTPAETGLSGLFTELSGKVDKRLIWVNTGGAEGTVYFDICPNFYDTEQTPDS